MSRKQLKKIIKIINYQKEVKISTKSKLADRRIPEKSRIIVQTAEKKLKLAKIC